MVCIFDVMSLSFQEYEKCDVFRVGRGLLPSGLYGKLRPEGVRYTFSRL